MKPILVPTDFSKPAYNAANYAWHVAKYLKSNLKLFHSFIVPIGSTVTGQMVWPSCDYGSLKDETASKLDELVNELMQKGKSLTTPNTFKPVVTHAAEASAAGQLGSKLMEQKGVGMIVAGMSGAGAVTKFFTGSTTRELIEKASLPILLVPSGCTFKPVNKIAFASDLNPKDIETINGLVGFARCFNAEIVIVHVDQNPAAYDRKKADAFLNEITCKINYDKIYYREVNSVNVNDGLQWLSEHGWIDMLVIVHRHGSFMERLLKGSFTGRQAARVKIPLLVLPEGPAPVF